MLDLTKISFLRRATKDYSSKEIATVITHLTKLKDEKISEEKILAKSIAEREKARLDAVKVLRDAGFTIPLDLSKELTLEGELKRRKEQRRIREAENVKNSLNDE